MSLCTFTMTGHPSQGLFLTHKDFIWSHNKFMYSSQWLFVMLAMTLCDLHNHIVHSKWLLCPHYDVECSWNDSAWPYRDLCDLLNDLLCILTMVCVSFPMSVLIIIRMIFVPSQWLLCHHNDSVCALPKSVWFLKSFCIMVTPTYCHAHKDSLYSCNIYVWPHTHEYVCTQADSVWSSHVSEWPSQWDCMTFTMTLCDPYKSPVILEMTLYDTMT